MVTSITLTFNCRSYVASQAIPQEMLPPGVKKETNLKVFFPLKINKGFLPLDDQSKESRKKHDSIFF